MVDFSCVFHSQLVGRHDRSCAGIDQFGSGVRQMGSYNSRGRSYIFSTASNGRCGGTGRDDGSCWLLGNRRRYGRWSGDNWRNIQVVVDAVLIRVRSTE